MSFMCVLFEVKHMLGSLSWSCVFSCRWQILIEFCAGGAVDAVMLGESAVPPFITGCFTNRETARTGSESGKRPQRTTHMIAFFFAFCKTLIVV